MATNLNKNSDIPSSVFHKTVCLEDWWLIKAEKDFNGRRLAIGGLVVREQGAVRVFSSSPIIKRYDLFTLKTADEITVIISGPINMSRTKENGFTSEVCSHFLVGFPYFWETYADQCFDKESTTRGGQKHEHEEDHLHASPFHATKKKTKEIPNKQEKLTLDGIEGTLEQSSSTKPDVVSPKISERGDLKMPPGQEQSNNKKQKKLGRKKRNVVPLPLVTRSTEKDLSLVSPESLSLGRSRAGRLLVRPQPFWCNPNPVYNVDRRITGVFTGYQDDPSHLGSSSGSRSEPPKKKRKLT